VRVRSKKNRTHAGEEEGVAEEQAVQRRVALAPEEQVDKFVRVEALELVTLDNSLHVLAAGYSTRRTF
jgi:hypothetical protein